MGYVVKYCLVSRIDNITIGEIKEVKQKGLFSLRGNQVLPEALKIVSSFYFMGLLRF
ncbi:MAG: hypothetical protein F7B11_02370 [Caldisphaeraceae archaeon]|nr:hypothetical protein [Caldisphaeraceae archaeon]